MGDYEEIMIMMGDNASFSAYLGIIQIPFLWNLYGR